MVSLRRIKELGQRIGREFDAERVVLFGSHARGTATEDSDVDLLVILPFKGRSVNQSVQMRMRLRPGFPVDLVVRTPETVSQSSFTSSSNVIGPPRRDSTPCLRHLRLADRLDTTDHAELGGARSYRSRI